MKRKTVRKWVIPAGAALLAAVMLGGYHYLNNGYPADNAAMAALEETQHLSVTVMEDMVIFTPAEPEAGLVFYPGGKVEHLAYAPVLRALAQEGIACILPRMPFDLAVLDMDAAREARGKLPEIQHWYLGGHSLGGAMAAAYAAECTEEYEGLILLAAYSTKDLNNSNMKVISLYGSEDEILNMEQYLTCRSNLPEDTVEQVLEGGNHAQFGSYGPQEGDGTATVTPEEQIAWAAEIISEKILDNIISVK